MHSLRRTGSLQSWCSSSTRAGPISSTAVKNKEYDLIINTPSGKLTKHDDSYIRKAAISYKVPYITTLSAAIAAAKGIAAYRQGEGIVKSLQEYHRDIR